MILKLQMKPIEIQHITYLPAEVLTLEKEAIAEGFRFLTRLISEWHSGKNSFKAPGEFLMAAYSNQESKNQLIISLKQFKSIES